MARTWLSVTVELLGGRDEDPWPWPGRIFAVGPSHTFLGLADAINEAFARWDRSHLSMFTLADGRIVTDDATGAELAASMGGPLVSPLDLDTVKVARTVKPGEEFQFTYDLGDDWTHRCVVGDRKIDPLEMLGIRPAGPLPYWGWGSIPDQYGRRWADDDGESRAPRRPNRPHPMRTHEWPRQEQMPDLELSEVRRAIAARDADGLIAALTGRDIDDVLQQVGPGLPFLLHQMRQVAEPITLSVVNRLTWRAWEGDRELAEDLLAALRGEPLPGRVVPVDLDLLTMEREGDLEMSTGGYIDLETGQVRRDAFTEPVTAQEGPAADVAEDPDRWLPLDITDSRDGWQDMAAFMQRQNDIALRQQMERAIEGRGAFGRFRDLVHDEGLADQWHAFATDRQVGRARAFLAAHGIRAGAQKRVPE